MCALLLALVLGLGTASAREPENLCLTDSLLGCDDHDPCTEDQCRDQTCVHTPTSGPACGDHDRCTRNDRCDAGRCAGVPITCDDGFACTDDVCVGGSCVHLPVDSRCVPEDQCTSAVCAPEGAAHDPQGCTAGAARTEGQECAEDGDACTADACAGGRCGHVELRERTACGAVQAAFRHALFLEASARILLAALRPELPGALVERVRGIEDALGATARALAGSRMPPHPLPRHSATRRFSGARASRSPSSSGRGPRSAPSCAPRGSARCGPRSASTWPSTSGGGGAPSCARRARSGPRFGV